MTRKGLLPAVFVLLAGFLLSGCFTLRELNWTKDRVPAGGTTKAKISLEPSGPAPEDSDRPFLMVATQTDFSGISLGPAVFDSTEVLGRRKRMIKDQSLALEIIDEDVCSEFLPATPALEQTRVFRTGPEVSSRKRRLVQATLRMKFGSTVNGGFLGVVLSGRWADDGDQVPEAGLSGDDGLICTGASSTSVFERH